MSCTSETHLRHILSGEILHLILMAARPLPFQVRDLCIRKLRSAKGAQTNPLDYLLGHVTRTVERFQGHDLEADKPRVLAIFDEAPAVPDEFFEAAQSWTHRILVIGNPLATDNFF